MTFDLSDEARRALDQNGPILVLGGPGSGKTTLSLLKAQRLLPDLQPGQEVLFLSFSRAAVRQVLLRCRDVLTTNERKLIAVKTYHAFCMDLLRAQARLLTGHHARIMFPSESRIRKAEHGAGWAQEEIRLADEEGVYTFDQFARSAARLLAGSAAAADLIASKYPVVILDEFQDTSDSQWDLVKRLAKRSRIIVLADPDQRIFDYDDRVDPERLNQLRAEVDPEEFDLGGENHRSPNAGILAFADAVLRNTALPQTRNVQLLEYWANAFAGTVHAAVVWTLRGLLDAGVEHPSVAVLTRTNALVGQVSSLLSASHTYASVLLAPLEHDVVWDAEQTSAAAEVVASILEWPQRSPDESVAATLDKIADYFDVKNANKASMTAANIRDRYRKLAGQARDGLSLKRPTKAAASLQVARLAGLDVTGNPAQDWLSARALLDGAGDCAEIFEHAKFVRLFRATDEIGRTLTEEWDRSGTYGNATQIVRRALEANLLNGDQREPRGCILMNLHKSKGKEFDGVILVEGQYAGQFFSPREAPPFEASRRLLRVGITRARHKVVLVRPQGAPRLTDGEGARPES